MEVKIKIKDPILRSYLAGLFEPRGGGYAVNMDTFTGTVICSLTSVADYPRRSDDDETTVLFHLPQSRYTGSFRNRYLFVTPEAEAKVNAVLKKEFDMNFIAFLTESRIQGFKLRDAIATFIVINKLDNFDGDIETLKKRYYRRELEALKNIREKLCHKAYSLTKMVKKQMNDNLIL